MDVGMKGETKVTSFGNLSIANGLAIDYVLQKSPDLGPEYKEKSKAPIDNGGDNPVKPSPPERDNLNRLNLPFPLVYRLGSNKIPRTLNDHHGQEVKSYEKLMASIRDDPEENKIHDDFYRSFLRGLELLGGDDNLSNITAEALHELVVKEMETEGGNCRWSLSDFEFYLASYSRRYFRMWNWKHHNKMLQAVEHLGGDAFNQERVNPKSVLEFMNTVNNDDSDCVTNIHGVSYNLWKLRKILKEKPNHPFCYPWEPKEPR